MDMLNVASTGMYTILALFVNLKKCIQKMNVIAKISCYLERAVVTLKLRKEYLNSVTHTTSVLLRIKYWTVWCIERYSMSTYTGVTNCQKTVRFFLAHPVDYSQAEPYSNWSCRGTCPPISQIGTRRKIGPQKYMLITLWNMLSNLNQEDRNVRKHAIGTARFSQKRVLLFGARTKRYV